ncbi:MAG: YHS domain-containing (seleno)protein [Phycisphaerales bacterium]
MKSLPIAISIIAAATLTGCSEHASHCVTIDGESAIAARTGPKIYPNVDDDGVILMGYDPVAYFTDAKPVMGSHEYMSVHNGAIYHFASAAHKQLFDADPAKYEPQFGGWCAYAASIKKISPIGPEWWDIVDGRLILQHNQKAWDLWHKDPKNSLVSADANWPGLVDQHGAPPKTLVNIDRDGVALEGHDPVAYFTDGKAIKGDPALASTYRGATYHFASAAHKQMFDANPEKYAPQFGGFCGYAASINKVSPVNVNLFQIIDGRLVLQHTDEAYRLFNQNAPANLVKADHNWPHLVARTCH